MPLLSTIIVSIGALAWVVMLMHHEHGHGPAASLQLAPGFQGAALALFSSGLVWMSGWAIMVVAMMLPPALPMLRMMARLGTNRQDRRSMVGIAAGAFIATWVLAGIVLWGAGTLLSIAYNGIDALKGHADIVSGVAALLVGAYQFTPLKHACLTACRSPQSVAMTRWSSEAPLRSAGQIGMHYGAICVGCCWALMILSFVVGALALPIMVIVSVFMLLERVLPSIRPLIPLQAALACVIGLLLLFGIIPPGFLVT